MIILQTFIVLLLVIRIKCFANVFPKLNINPVIVKKAIYKDKQDYEGFFKCNIPKVGNKAILLGNLEAESFEEKNLIEIKSLIADYLSSKDSPLKTELKSDQFSVEYDPYNLMSVTRNGKTTEANFFDQVDALSTDIKNDEDLHDKNYDNDTEYEVSQKDSIEDFAKPKTAEELVEFFELLNTDSKIQKKIDELRNNIEESYLNIREAGQAHLRDEVEPLFRKYLVDMYGEDEKTTQRDMMMIFWADPHLFLKYIMGYYTIGAGYIKNGLEYIIEVLSNLNNSLEYIVKNIYTFSLDEINAITDVITEAQREIGVFPKSANTVLEQIEFSNYIYSALPRIVKTKAILGQAELFARLNEIVTRYRDLQENEYYKKYMTTRNVFNSINSKKLHAVYYKGEKIESLPELYKNNDLLPFVVLSRLDIGECTEEVSYREKLGRDTITRSSLIVYGMCSNGAKKAVIFKVVVGICNIEIYIISDALCVIPSLAAPVALQFVNPEDMTCSTKAF